MASAKQLERMILDAGGQFLRSGTHKHYMLAGQFLSIHKGGRGCSREEKTIISAVRRATRKKAV